MTTTAFHVLTHLRVPLDSVQNRKALRAESRTGREMKRWRGKHELIPKRTSRALKVLQRRERLTLRLFRQLAPHMLTTKTCLPVALVANHGVPAAWTGRASYPLRELHHFFFTFSFSTAAQMPSGMETASTQVSHRPCVQFSNQLQAPGPSHPITQTPS